MIRSDKGGENTDMCGGIICCFTIIMDPTCSIITGPSTHNERIERLLYDVFRFVGQVLYSMLYSLEEKIL